MLSQQLDFLALTSVSNPTLGTRILMVFSIMMRQSLKLQVLMQQDLFTYIEIMSVVLRRHYFH